MMKVFCFLTQTKSNFYIQSDKAFLFLFQGGQLTSANGGQFALAEGVILNWRNGVNLERIFQYSCYAMEI
jgi:hypothetical protein